ncbi:alpha/beta hydrolase [Metabacillus fastidiosus]|uniref:alpha/beta hydrolase n=1 Tax=Metabacillus fastidiosus TaxID=1458 RepID=UPI002E2084CD|nr:alpha/beta hydrolase [Metabacillus fastidiosus]
MSYYEGCPELDAVLNKHKASANSMLSTAQSQLLCDTFSKVLAYLFSTNESVEGDVLNLNVEKIKTKISKWKKDIDDCLESFKKSIQGKDELTDEDRYKQRLMEENVKEIKKIYDKLREEMDGVELDFQNAVRTYRSPIRQALNDISMLYDSENNVKGDFSKFENVSVYVHGIEDRSDGFLRNVKKTAEIGDVIIYQKENEETEYFTVVIEDGKRKIVEYKEFRKFEEAALNENIKGRLHIIYDTEHRNEHRQETSDDLAQKLNEMGVINDKAKIDMFAHSYGGRRSLQFAIDYPDNVRSITTIGTPYDTNMMAQGANNVRWFAEKVIKKNPKETSAYLDFNEKNRNDINGLKYSNAYTDMSSEPLSEDINKLKAAYPKVYEKLQQVEITAVAGYRKEVKYYAGPRIMLETKTSSDDTVSIKSQNAEILGDLIDKRPQIEVKGSSIKDPGHIYEVEDEEFIALMREVNKKQKNRSIE